MNRLQNISTGKEFKQLSEQEIEIGKSNLEKLKNDKEILKKQYNIDHQMKPPIEGSLVNEFNEPIEIQIEKLIEKIKDETLPDDQKINAITQLKQMLEKADGIEQVPPPQIQKFKPSSLKPAPKLEIKKQSLTKVQKDDEKSVNSDDDDTSSVKSLHYNPPPYYPPPVQANPPIIMMNQPSIM